MTATGPSESPCTEHSPLGILPISTSTSRARPTRTGLPAGCRPSALPSPPRLGPPGPLRPLVRRPERQLQVTHLEPRAAPRLFCRAVKGLRLQGTAIARTRVGYAQHKRVTKPTKKRGRTIKKQI